jgi:hypothetical protein
MNKQTAINIAFGLAIVLLFWIVQGQGAKFEKLQGEFLLDKFFTDEPSYADTSTERVYSDEIDWDDINISASVRTKYFSEKLNYIFEQTNNNESCTFNKSIGYIVYFRDSDGFDITSTRVINGNFTQDAENECRRRIQGSIALDEELYKRISEASVATSKKPL